MTDPTRYIRKAITNALQLNDFVVYGQNPPSSAVAPYGILTVNTAAIPAKNCEMYRVTSTVEVYSEYREYGGRKSIDEISDNIITIMVPNNYTYLLIEGFEHSNVRLVSSDERVSVVDSITTYIKTMRFEHLISKN
jgi:hypothetical protein